MTQIKLIFTTFLLAFSIISIAQNKLSEGIIEYKMKVAGTDNLEPQQAAMIKSMMESMKMVTSFKGDWTKVEIENSFMKSLVVSNAKKKESKTRTEVMGQTYDAIMTDKDLFNKKAKATKPTIEYVDETKEIAGYVCKKAIVKTEESTIIVYYTKEIEVRNQDFSQNNFEGLDGFPMEIEMEQNGMKIITYVSKVEPKKIDDTIFEMPKNFTPMAWEDYEKNFKGRF